MWTGIVRTGMGHHEPGGEIQARRWARTRRTAEYLSPTAPGQQLASARLRRLAVRHTSSGVPHPTTEPQVTDQRSLDPQRALPTPSWAGYATPESPPDPALPRTWWDGAAAGYLSEHRDDLGDAEFVWGPEGLREADAGLLGDLAGCRVLEIGAGAKQCSRWLVSRGIDVVASDISGAMLAAGAALDVGSGIGVPAVQADARALPLADATFDVVFTSYGVLQFVPDAEAVHREVARVLRDGGRWVFSVNHPVRWAFPDDPGEDGLRATRSYYDTRPYLERGDDGTVLYAEYHRTLGQYVAAVSEAGFVVTGVVEPQWRPGARTWGGWSELRANYLPGTIVLQCRHDR